METDKLRLLLRNKILKDALRLNVLVIIGCFAADDTVLYHLINRCTTTNVSCRNSKALTIITQCLVYISCRREVTGSLLIDCAEFRMLESRDELFPY